jgi:hypothetical protein
MHTSLESVGTSFDEHQNRTTEKLRCDKWQEYLVAWRKDQIELYQNYVRIYRSVSLVDFNLKRFQPPPSISVCTDGL